MNKKKDLKKHAQGKEGRGRERGSRKRKGNNTRIWMQIKVFFSSIENADAKKQMKKLKLFQHLMIFLFFLVGRFGFFF